MRLSKINLPGDRKEQDLDISLSVSQVFSSIYSPSKPRERSPGQGWHVVTKGSFIAMWDSEQRDGERISGQKGSKSRAQNPEYLAPEPW